jgi:hypothetical protein
MSDGAAEIVKEAPGAKKGAAALPSWLTMKEGGLLQSDPLATAAFIVCILLSLCAWGLGSNEERLRVPLLLSGLSAIVLFVIRRESAAVAFVAVLIVGVLVAPRDYLLRIAHMIARPTAAFEDYAKRYEGEASDPAVVSKAITDRVAEALKKQGVEVDANTRRAIGDVVTETEAERITERIRRGGAETPLSRVVTGGDTLRDFVREFGSSEFFRRHMELLRAERLVEFSGAEFSSSRPTPLGEQINRRLQRPDSAFSLETSRSSGRTRPPPEGEMTQIRVPETRQVQIISSQPVWFKFDVSQSSRYQILVKATDKSDMALALFSAKNNEQIAYDDDSGGGVDPKLERSLDPGRYFVRLDELFALGSKGVTATLSIRRLP